MFHRNSMLLCIDSIVWSCLNKFCELWFVDNNVRSKRIAYYYEIVNHYMFMLI